MTCREGLSSVDLLSCAGSRGRGGDRVSGDVGKHEEVMAIFPDVSRTPSGAVGSF